VLRNYQQELTNQGGQTLFECKGAECGGSDTRSSSGGGVEMSLSMYLWPEDSIREEYFTNGHCAQTAWISYQRYTLMELPQNGAYVSVLTYLLEDDSYCKAFNDRTIAVVDVIEVTGMEAKMVTINAEEMAQAIARDGSVALYGIYFDSGKADIKPESAETLEQIAKFLANTPELDLLIVGHTDNVGSFESNMDLSKRRAEAVVNALTSTYEIDNARLMAVGVSFAAPVATNATEEGRAKNRRVELVGK
jgi:outer membrane protein OmpA-like peptidoglycan-associated protein